jgi:hypothetical protein
MEVGLHDDDDLYPFSARSHEELLAASADYRSPWHGGVRDFLEMQVVGLARLHTAIQLDEAHIAVYYHGRSPSLPTSAGYAARKLAEWLRALRYHQTVKRYLDQEGFARRQQHKCTVSCNNCEKRSSPGHVDVASCDRSDL